MEVVAVTAFAWAVVAVFSLGCLLLGFWVGWQTGREHGYEEHRRETLEQMASAEPMDPARYLFGGNT